jgi:hypothetical protein
MHRTLAGIVITNGPMVSLTLNALTFKVFNTSDVNEDPSGEGLYTWVAILWPTEATLRHRLEDAGYRDDQLK